MRIIPSILENNFSEIDSKLKRLEGLVTWAQVDVVDGVFAPRETWMTAEDLKNVKGKIKIEVHLMVDNPEEILVAWLPVADGIVVHWESLNNPHDLIEAMKVNNSRPVLAFNLETPLELAEEYIRQVKFVQLMSIENIGYQGEAFSEIVLDRIKEVKKINPDILVQVDGGINMQTAPLCLAAGADSLIIGSALWKNGEISDKIKEFKNIK